MTHPAVTVRPEDSVEQAARLMYNLRIKRLPVVDAGGYLAGIDQPDRRARGLRPPG